MTALQAVGLYTGLNLILLLFLGVRTGLARTKTKVSLGDGGNEELTCAVRAHANHAEWFPGALVGLLILAMLGAPLLFIHGLGVALTLGRAIHAYGFIMEGGKGVSRTMGALLTVLVYAVGGLALLWFAIQ